MRAVATHMVCVHVVYQTRYFLLTDVFVMRRLIRMFVSGCAGSLMSVLHEYERKDTKQNVAPYMDSMIGFDFFRFH